MHALLPPSPFLDPNTPFTIDVEKFFADIEEPPLFLRERPHDLTAAELMPIVEVLARYR